MGVIAAGLVVAWVIRDTTENETAAEGARAPGFAVEVFGGGDFDLVAHIENDGRPVVLNLWASWCAPCRTEIPEISAWSSENPDVYVIGVAVEDRRDDALALADELSPEYDMAFGDIDFRNAYPSLGLPATYFIDSRGMVAEIINGIVTGESLDTAMEAIPG